MYLKFIKALATSILVLVIQGCAELYESISCSNNTSPVFTQVTSSATLFQCGPHERCQRVSLDGTDIWIKWEGQEYLILGMWGFYDKEVILDRSIANLKLSIIDKANPSVIIKKYSNLKWKNGEPSVKLDHKIKNNEIYSLSFDLIIVTTSGSTRTFFSGSLEKGVVKTCVPLV